MVFHRVTLVALATFFSIGMTSLASACCGLGFGAPVAYAPVAPVGFGGCGGCGAPTAAAVFAQPVAPAPIVVTTVPTGFGGPCCNIGGCGDCAAATLGCGTCGAVNFGCNACAAVRYGCGTCGGYAVAAPSLYVVDQGPVYSGPALTVPYATYSPELAYAPATDYPYVSSPYVSGFPAYPSYAARYYRHPYYRYRPHYGYRGPGFAGPRYYRPGPRYYGAPRYSGAAHWRHFP